jgi:hypothetical protein
MVATCRGAFVMPTKTPGNVTEDSGWWKLQANPWALATWQMPLYGQLASRIRCVPRMALATSANDEIREQRQHGSIKLQRSLTQHVMANVRPELFHHVGHSINADLGHPPLAGLGPRALALGII